MEPLFEEGGPLREVLTSERWRGEIRRDPERLEKAATGLFAQSLAMTGKAEGFQQLAPDQQAAVRKEWDRLVEAAVPGSLQAPFLEQARPVGDFWMDTAPEPAPTEPEPPNDLGRYQPSGAAMMQGWDIRTQKAPEPATPDPGKPAAFAPRDAGMTDRYGLPDAWARMPELELRERLGREEELNRRARVAAQEVGPAGRAGAHAVAGSLLGRVWAGTMGALHEEITPAEVMQRAVALRAYDEEGNAAARWATDHLAPVVADLPAFVMGARLPAPVLLPAMDLVGQTAEAMGGQRDGLDGQSLMQSAALGAVLRYGPTPAWTKTLDGGVVTRVGRKVAGTATKAAEATAVTLPFGGEADLEAFASTFATFLAMESLHLVRAGAAGELQGRLQRYGLTRDEAARFANRAMYEGDPGTLAKNLRDWMARESTVEVRGPDGRVQRIDRLEGWAKQYVEARQRAEAATAAAGAGAGPRRGSRPEEAAPPRRAQVEAAGTEPPPPRPAKEPPPVPKPAPRQLTPGIPGSPTRWRGETQAAAGGGRGEAPAVSHPAAGRAMQVPEAPANAGTGAGTPAEALPEGAVVAMPVREIAVRPDLMQFKRMDDATTGVNEAERLDAPDWDPLKGGNLLVWEPVDGGRYVLEPDQRFIVANGHHRMEFARRKGVRAVNAQVLREADGWTPARVRAYAAEINIADGKGSVYDQAKYFRNTAAAFGTDEALARRDTVGSRGREAADIGILASNSTFDAWINERINAGQAVAIARTGAGNEGLQALGVKRALAGRSGPLLAAEMQLAAAERAAGPGMEQGDLFGFDDAAIRAMAQVADRVNAMDRVARDLRASAASPAKRTEAARRMGVDVEDVEATRRKIEALDGFRARLDAFATDGELLRELRAEDFDPEAAVLRVLEAVDAPPAEAADAPAPSVGGYRGPGVDHTILSPDGRVSQRAREEALRRTAAQLFPPGFWDAREPTIEDLRRASVQALRRQARDLRELAERGMQPNKYRKEADARDAQAAALEAEWKGQESPATAAEPGAPEGGWVNPFTGQREMFGQDEGGFQLTGDKGTDYARVQREQDARDEARREADQQQGRLFEEPGAAYGAAAAATPERLRAAGVPEEQLGAATKYEQMWLAGVEQAGRRGPVYAGRGPGGDAADSPAVRVLRQPGALNAPWAEAFGDGDTISNWLPQYLTGTQTGMMPWRGLRVQSAADVTALMMVLRSPFQESTKVLWLDRDGRIVRGDVVYLGTVSEARLEPREVFRRAPREAAGFIVSHNHPSGEVMPSSADLAATRRMAAVGKGLGIPLVDHVVTDDWRYTSLADEYSHVLEFEEPRQTIPPPTYDAPPGRIPREGEGPGLERSPRWGRVAREALTQIRSSKDAQPILQGLRQGDPDVGHVLVLNTSMALVGVHRFPLSMAPQELGQRVTREVLAVGGSMQVLMEAPLNLVRIGPVMQAVGAALKRAGVTLLDVFDGSGQSMREVGMFNPGTTDSWGAVQEGRDPWTLREPRSQPLMLPGPPPPGSANSNEPEPLALGMVELVWLERELLAGKFPQIRKNLGKALGRFSYMEGQPVGDVKLRADLFQIVTPTEQKALRERLETDIQRANPRAAEGWVKQEADRQWPETLRAETERLAKVREPIPARRTLAHEIGHVVDWLPDWTLKRGNIFGRIATLKKYLGSMLAEVPSAENNISAQKRAKLRRAAEKEVLAAGGERGETGSIERLEFNEAVRAMYAEMLRDAADAQGLVMKQDVLEELRQAIAWWRGWAVRDRKIEKLPVTGMEIDRGVRPLTEMGGYFEQPEEMWADTISILLNNPTALRERAPAFWRMWHAYLGRKPAVKSAWEEIQRTMRTGEFKHRARVSLRRGFAEADRRIMAMEDAFRQMSMRERIDALESAFDARWAPLYSRIRKAGEATAASGSRARQAVRDWLYHRGMHELYLTRISDEVMRPLGEAGVDREMWNEYLFHQHVVHNRMDVANPFGFSPKTSAEALQAMRRELGETRWAAVEQADARRWAIRQDEVLWLLRQSGALGPDLQALIEEREHYATVQPSRANEEDLAEAVFKRSIGSAMTARIYSQVGYLGEQASPMLATARKDLRLITMAYKSMLGQSLERFLAESGEPLYRPAEMRATQAPGGPVFQEPVEIENARVGTIIYMRQGKVRAFYAPQAIVQAWREEDPKQLQAVIDITRGATSAIKSWWTELNYGFWPFAFMRDVESWAQHVPGATGGVLGPRAYLRYHKRAKAAAESLAAGQPNETARLALRRNMLISTRRRFGDRSDEEAFTRLMRSYRVDPSVWGVEGEGTDSGRMHRFWQWYQTRGQVLERSLKIAGMLHLDETRKDMPEAEKQAIVHRFSGSPDFLERGSANWIMDAVAPFYNPAKQGIKQEAQSARERPAAWMLNKLRYALMPKLMLVLGLPALLRLLKGRESMEEYLLMYRSIPSYDRQNYDCVPLGWADRQTYRVLYYRQTKSEGTRMVGGVAGQLADAVVLDQRLKPTDVVNWGAGNLPGGNPAWAVPAGWLDLARGQNPHDDFRGRPVVDQTAFDAGAPLPDMARWTWNSLGGSILYQWREPMGAVDPLAIEKALGLPIVSNTLGRFLKVSNRGIYQDLAAAAAPGEEAYSRERYQIQQAEQAGRPLPDDLSPRGMGYAFDRGRMASQVVRSQGPMQDAMDRARSSWERQAIMERMRQIDPPPPQSVVP